MKHFHFALFLITSGLVANPTVAPTLVQGSATVSGIGSSTVTVNVSTTSNVLNWNNFSNVQGEQVSFSSSTGSAPYAVYNRITGGTASQINGSITSTNNGNIYLINPAGIIIGPSGMVTTGAFVASTLDVVGSFNPAATSMQFTGSSTNSITNNGTITTATGDVTIISYSIVNTGNINAAGVVAVGAGSNILLQPAANQRVFIQAPVSNTNTGGVGINHGGTTQGQSVILNADGGLYALAINLTGVVNSTVCTPNNGNITIMAEPGTTPPCSGSIQIAGSIGKSSVGGYGPAVNIVAQQIALLPGSIINASGNNGGGSVTIGSSTAVCPTRYVWGAPTALIASNALTSGNGGNVTIYATDSLLFSGTVQAQGIGAGNSGGNVQLNCLNFLGVDGVFNLFGPTYGTTTFLTNTLQVDGPLSIAAVTAGSPVTLYGVTTIYGGNYFPGSLGVAANTNIPAAALGTTLGNSNVVLTAQQSPGGSIVISSPVTWSSGTTLTMTAIDLIDINALLTMTGTTFTASPILNLNASRVYVNSGPAGVLLTSGAISVNTGELFVQGGSTLISIAEITTLNGAVYITFGTFLYVYGGTSAGADAAIQGTSVVITTTTQGVGNIEVIANDCTKAYIDGTTVTIGANGANQPKTITIQGGCCSSDNEAYIGNYTSSQIFINATGDISLTGGIGGSGNKASIISGGGGNTVTINAYNLFLQGGSGGVNTAALIASYGTGGTVNLLLGNDIELTGGGFSAINATASVEGDLVSYTAGRDVELTGGSGQMNSAFIQAYSTVQGVVGRNHTMTSGTGVLASAELRVIGPGPGLISLNSSTGASDFVFDSSGNNKSFVRVIIFGNGNINIGQNGRPFDIEFTAGNGGDPYVLITIIGNGNINISAIQDIVYQGGGAGNATAGVIIVGIGNIMQSAGRDLNLFAGSTPTSDVFLQTGNGTVTTQSGRDNLLVGSCTIPNKAYLLSQGGQAGILVMAVKSVTLKGQSYFSVNTPVLDVPISIGRLIKIHTPTLSVQDCSAIMINGEPITPPQKAGTYPGKYFYKYVFLYEMFYRLNYYDISRWSLCDSPWFWNNAMYSAP